MKPVIKYQHLLGRLVNTPLLTTEPRALTLFGLLAPRAGWSAEARIIAAGGDEPPRLLSDLTAAVPRLDGPRDERKVYRVVDGVAVIPVEGDLVNKLGALDPWCGMTGYDAIVYKLDEAEADPEVRGIALEINSLGGEALGCETAGDAIRRCSKPTRAIVWEAYSAACWTASQCDRVIVTRMGGTGSVGVVNLHVDRTKQMADEGLTVTVLRAGAHKAEGDPFTPLADDVKARAVADMEALRRIFAQAVAEGRGMSIGDVLATEAATFLAAEAVDIGLADEVMTPDDALAQFIADLDHPGRASQAAGAAENQQKGQTMAPRKGQKARAGTRAAHLDDEVADEDASKNCQDDQEDGDDPNEDGDEDGDEEDRDDEDGDHCDDDGDSLDDDEGDDGEGGDDASTKAKARVKAILGSPEGKANPGLAQHLALETNMSVKAARKALKASGGGASRGRAGAFASAMADRAGPRLGAGGRRGDTRSLLTAAVDRQMAQMRQTRKGGAK